MVTVAVLQAAARFHILAEDELLDETKIQTRHETQLNLKQLNEFLNQLKCVREIIIL